MGVFVSVNIIQGIMKKGTIIVQVCGGLGNQLFQYAFARALQEKGNRVYLAAVFYTKYRTQRTYLLDNFYIKLKRAYWAEKLIAPLADNDLPFKIRTSHIHEEMGMAYAPKLLDIEGNHYLIGLFQDERYFKSISAELKKEICPRKRIKISKELSYILKNENTASVHIRRGDYKQTNNLLNISYYKKAVDLMESKIDNAFFCVFSDDLNWARRHFDFVKNAYFINQDRRLMDYEELMIMSRCRHHIIANSTFSWWGAWLNSSFDKIVIGPKNWILGSKVNIMPDAWIRL